jgi:IS30 family transposase
MGGVSSQIATLVERQSRYVMLVKVDSKDSDKVAKALARKIRDLPSELRRSLTWDRGAEMAAHREFTIATDMQVYFCDPRSPWQRGSNENTNGLLRQYFPKGQDLSQTSQARLNYVARELNERPRETLNWRTPLQALRATVASTG